VKFFVLSFPPMATHTAIHTAIIGNNKLADELDKQIFRRSFEFSNKGTFVKDFTPILHISLADIEHYKDRIQIALVACEYAEAQKIVPALNRIGISTVDACLQSDEKENQKYIARIESAQKEYAKSAKRTIDVPVAVVGAAMWTPALTAELMLEYAKANYTMQTHDIHGVFPTNAIPPYFLKRHEKELEI
jgi:hypothetical protein